MRKKFILFNDAVFGTGLFADANASNFVLTVEYTQ